MPRRLGGPCQAPVEENSDGICGFEGQSSTWYGKRGHQFCGSHRAAWVRWCKESGAEEEEAPSYLTEMDTLLGTRYCEPSKMKAAEKYNDVEKSSVEYCVQGTFTPEGYARGQTDTRWQTLAQLTESCSREDFVELYQTLLKDLEKSFKRDAKRFKTASQLARE